jgi:NAD(P)-dependent dehydrogenase (short-subunit alcohol dehydrogenase family)
MSGFIASHTIAIPLAHVSLPDKVAKVVLFLASDESGYVSGVELFIDGGMAQI